MQSKFLIVLLILVSFLLVSCSPEIQDSKELQINEELEVSETKQITSPTSDWRDFTLTNLNGENFKVSDFSGKPILIESFAVWCPTCTRQQNEIKKFHEEVGDAVVSISLDTDPNEDVAKVKAHTLQHGFDWHYVISPPDFTQSLIGVFGIGVVNAPSAPVILVCEDQSFRMLDSGVKDVSELKEEIERGCN
jgi:cytochrome oxidase Cu insertion factor (SCO1/SenC/PrrC family)